MSKNTITITNNQNNKSYEYDILDATRGPSVANTSSFYKDTGMFMYDPGFTSTANCKSDITSFVLLIKEACFSFSAAVVLISSLSNAALT